MEPKIKINIEEKFENIRFDKWFKKNIKSIPQSLIERFLRKGKILVNKKKIKSSYKIQTNDLVEIFKDINNNQIYEKVKFTYLPSKKDYQSIKNNIIFENNDYFVFNKSGNLAVQSGTKTNKNLFDILKNYENTEYSNPYLVHRLDVETTGILIIAKNSKSAKFFSDLFKNRKINKFYLAVVHGIIEKKSGTLKNELIYVENNQERKHLAITDYKVISENQNYSLLSLFPETGRKHQLRRQLSFIKHPIVGEKKYTNKSLTQSKKINLLLHAYKISFFQDKKEINYKIDPPLIFLNFCKDNQLILE
jgi:23S rRNA pseudouridine955/2504/2580 synthase